MRLSIMFCLMFVTIRIMFRRRLLDDDQDKGQDDHGGDLLRLL
jgi:hypothetical protein